MTPENSQAASSPQKAGESTAAFERPDAKMQPPASSADAMRPPDGNGTSNFSIGGTIGKYRITGVLGQGGMGIVLKGYDPTLERDVAIKVLADRLAADATALGRFLAEAKTAAKLNHANVIAIHEICQEGPTHYLILEYAAGGSLGDRLEKQMPYSALEATQALMDACRGISAAHAAGIVHRDIKPANLLKAADGSVKVADLGLAKTISDPGKQLTQAGIVVGTPFFMSPEQCEAKPLDHRSDIYSLGATYYSLLTGKHPYDDTDQIAQLMYLHCHGPIPDPRAVNPGVPEACCRVIARAMAKAPAERYQSMGQMFADLQALAATLSGQTRIDLPSDHATVAAPTPPDAPVSAMKQEVYASRRWLWIVALGVVILGGALAAWLGRDGKSESRDSPAGKTEPAAPGPLAATAPGVTPTDITFGMSAPFSGPAKELGRGMQIGVETYLQHVNETGGGIHGRKLKLLALDDGYEPERCMATMKEMINQRPVFCFAGNVGTPTAEVAVPIALEHKRVFCGAFTGAGLLRRDPPDRYVFNYRASYAEETAAIVQHLLTVRRVQPEEIAVFAQQDGYGDAGFSGVAKALRKAGFDASRIFRVGYERNSMNLDAAVRGLLEHKDQIKAVVMVPTYRQAAAFIKRVMDGGMKPIFTSVSFVDSDALAEALKELGPSYADGVIVTQVVPFFGSGATGVLEYRDRLSRYFPAEQPGFVSLEGYIAARVLCAGLEKAGPDLTTEKLVDALESIQGLDFGIGTKLSFGPSEHQASHKIWAVTLDGRGRFRNLDLD
jgi:eukaryotic-like serine/threonine-protein kinase